MLASYIGWRPAITDSAALFDTPSELPILRKRNSVTSDSMVTENIVVPKSRLGAPNACRWHPAGSSLGPALKVSKSTKQEICINGDSGCPRAGWTIQQFCSVCHAGTSSSSGEGVPVDGPSRAPRALGGRARIAVSPSLISPPVSTDHVTCVGGIGRCPQVGWTIDQFCPMCHG